MGFDDAKSTLRELIVEKARETLGTPFHHQGRLAGAGIDCVGLLVHVAKSLNIPHVDLAVYPLSPRGRWLEEILQKSLLPIQASDAGVGDVVCFWMRRPDLPQHVGIVSEASNGKILKIVHTYADVGKVVEHNFSGHWPNRIASVWRYPGVE